MVDHGLQLYLKEVVIHINDYEVELNELTQLSTLNNRDYRAGERLLQLLAEVSIGLAKHWLKSLKKETGSNAYQTFIGLHELGNLTDVELNEWRKIIGLRNSLVHDYLNIDKSIIKLIIKDKKYQTLLCFSQQAINVLNNNCDITNSEN
ncbi:MAG: hypothetical protein COB35_06790 [Gammaproteobacteria bacterium]|nr:MAG: hypothetical protein COB35_06790 [Gammaproteobacteria bacterium]